MNGDQSRWLLVGIVPAVAIGIAFELFLGHRHDYTGHFLAGYGGTYGAVLMWLRSLTPEQYFRRGSLYVVVGCVACILLGAVLEMTAFRIAKFDEVDFCNQSLGAVAAAVAALTLVQPLKPADRTFDFGLISGIALLGIGACYAVA